MKNPRQLRAAVSRPKARPSRLADTELDHLEKIIWLMAQSDPYTPTHGLDMAYWRRRVALIESSFELLPIQRSRMTALLALLD
jgi:hypothetical protein